LTLPLGVFPDERMRTIEFIAKESTGFVPYPPYSYEARSPESEESIELGSLLTVHVPPMQKHDTIFFELAARCSYTWSGYELRKTKVGVNLQLINPDIIPEDMEIQHGLGIPWDTVENNTMNKGTEHFWRSFKFAMKRNCDCGWKSDYLAVYYKTGDLVPEEVAIPIINALTDNGYDIEITISGTIQGVNKMSLGGANLEITRLSKNYHN